MKYLFVLLFLVSCVQFPDEREASKEIHKKMAIEFCSCHGGIKFYNRGAIEINLECNDGSGHRVLTVSLEEHEFYSNCTKFND